MHTPAHLIFAVAAFGKPDQQRITWYAMLGGFLPDLSLYLMAGVSIFLLDISPGQVFDELYYSAEWQQVFAIDNSFVLWGIVFALAVWRKLDAGVAIAGGALLHLAFDFPLHHDDARMHFWPVTDWKFFSPVSYWDPAFYGNIVGAIEMSAVAGLTVWVLRRFKDIWVRAAISCLALLQLAPFLIWSLLF